MEKKTEILVIGTNEQILATVLRLLNTNELWHATGVSTSDAAINACKERAFQVLLIGAGLTDKDEETLSDKVKVLHPGIQIIPHYGGGSGLLFAEIYLALGTNNQAQ
jgi:DNA-binding NtrC family response regulator